MIAAIAITIPRASPESRKKRSSSRSTIASMKGPRRGLKKFTRSCAERKFSPMITSTRQNRTLKNPKRIPLCRDNPVEVRSQARSALNLESW